MSSNSMCFELHRFILHGKCPWCGLSVDPDNSPLPSDGAVQWDIPAINALLDDPSSNGSSFAILSYIMSRMLPTAATFPFYRKALCQKNRRIRWLAACILTERGRELGLEEAEQHEAESLVDPDDSSRHILLLGFHSNSRSSLLEPARIARRRHVRWIVENAPELAFPGCPDSRLEPSNDGDAYYDVERLWLKHVSDNPQNALILGNAAAFFADTNRQLSIDLLNQALNLEPDSCGWLYDLTVFSLSELRRRPTDGFSASIRSIFTELPNMIKGLGKESDRLWLLPDLSYLALELGELDIAHAYATEALAMASVGDPFFPETGKALHHANLILGRISLRKGNTATAATYLLKAVSCQDSAFLEVIGPGLLLAKELLDVGERTAVIQYLKLCSNFWHTPDHRPDRWIYILEHGGYPDFDSDLS